MEQVKEKKKVLTGWPILNGTVLLAGGNPGLVTQEHHNKIQSSLLAVQNRPNFIPQNDVIFEPTQELNTYLQGFWGLPELAAFVQEGWTAKIADLSKVCTVQPVVEDTNSKERTSNIPQDDYLAIANISLPKQNMNTLSITFDKNATVFSSPNPNLRIVGNFNTPDNLYGFAVGINNSYVQVAKCQGRYFLRDGTHRAYGFLSNDVRKIPVLYKEFNTVSDMGLPAGCFQVETLLGDKPPMLTDYFDDSVSSEAEFVRPTKVVIVQGLEVVSN
jgi:hypothetical protein